MNFQWFIQNIAVHLPLFTSLIIIFQKRLKLELCSITLCHKFSGFVNLDSESTEWSKIGGGTIKVRVRESIWIITTYSPIHKILSCKIAPNWPIWKKGSVARERCLYLRTAPKHTAHFTAFYIFFQDSPDSFNLSIKTDRTRQTGQWCQVGDGENIKWHLTPN